MTPDFKAYLEKPNHCPWCKCEETLIIKGISFDYVGDFGTIPIKCPDCRKTWVKYYTFSAVSDPETGETHTKEEKP